MVHGPQPEGESTKSKLPELAPAGPRGDAVAAAFSETCVHTIMLCPRLKGGVTIQAVTVLLFCAHSVDTVEALILEAARPSPPALLPSERCGCVRPCSLRQKQGLSRLCVRVCCGVSQCGREAAAGARRESIRPRLWRGRIAGCAAEQEDCWHGYGTRQWAEVRSFVTASTGGRLWIRHCVQCDCVRPPCSSPLQVPSLLWPMTRACERAQESGGHNRDGSAPALWHTRADTTESTS